MVKINSCKQKNTVKSNWKLLKIGNKIKKKLHITLTLNDTNNFVSVDTLKANVTKSSRWSRKLACVRLQPNVQHTPQNPKVPMDPRIPNWSQNIKKIQERQKNNPIELLVKRKTLFADDRQTCLAYWWARIQNYLASGGWYPKNTINQRRNKIYLTLNNALVGNPITDGLNRNQ